MSVGEATAIICRRHRFLREKLLTALKEGSKIFVYKSSVRTLNDEQLRGLHGAVRLFGKSALLYVRVEDATHPNGTVELAAPGLMIGYIDHFTHSPTDEFLGPSANSWAEICRLAYAMWHAQQAEEQLQGQDNARADGQDQALDLQSSEADREA